MRESIGNAYLFYFVIVFIGIFVVLLVGSISYSKAFKIKNNIINVIEENGTWTNGNTGTQGRVNTMLARIGYTATPQNVGHCPNIADGTLVHDRVDDYMYCVYRIDENRGTRYRVVSYMHIEIPIVAGVLRIPVQGETKTMIDFN